MSICRLLAPGKQQAAKAQDSDQTLTHMASKSVSGDGTATPSESQTQTSRLNTLVQPTASGSVSVDGTATPSHSQARTSEVGHLHQQGSTSHQHNASADVGFSSRPAAVQAQEGHFPAEGMAHQQPLQQPLPNQDRLPSAPAVDRASNSSMHASVQPSRQSEDSRSTETTPIVPQGIQLLLSQQPQQPSPQPKMSASQHSVGATPAEPGSLLLLCVLNMMPRYTLQFCILHW